MIFNLVDQKLDHTDQVRGGDCAIINNQRMIVTTSFDQFVKLWVLTSSGELNPISTLIGHSNFVIDAKFLPPSTFCSSNRIVSIGYDKKMIIWRLDRIGSEKELIWCQIDDAHEKQICCVDTFLLKYGAAPNQKSRNFIVTGSWDNKVKLWSETEKGFELFKTFEGHKSSVLCVSGFQQTPNSKPYLISGSGDSEIKFWDFYAGNCLATLNKKECSCIRSLLPFQTQDSLNFFFSSNSGDIQAYSIQKLTTTGGPVLNTTQIPSKSFLGHENLVYNLNFFPNSKIGAVDPSHSVPAKFLCSVSEDTTVKIWEFSDGEATLRQIIQHPGCVWKVLTFPSTSGAEEVGEIVTLCADGHVRVFSSDPKVFGKIPQSKVDEFAKMVEDSRKQAAKKQEGGEEQVESKSLPPRSMLMTLQGNKNGEIKMVRNEETGKGEAHSWNAKEKKWDYVGEIYGTAPGGEGGESSLGLTEQKGGEGQEKKFFGGQYYDYVFDVNLDNSGGKNYKLPFNIGDNPFAKAREFLKDNDIPFEYFDEVAQFLVKNTPKAGYEEEKIFNPWQ